MRGRQRERCACVCVCESVRAWVRARVRACVCVCAAPRRFPHAQVRLATLPAALGSRGFQVLPPRIWHVLVDRMCSAVLHWRRMGRPRPSRHCGAVLSRITASAPRLCCPRPVRTKPCSDRVVVGTSLFPCLSRSCFCLCLLSRFALLRVSCLPPFFVSLPSPPSRLSSPPFSLSLLFSSFSFLLPLPLPFSVRSSSLFASRFSFRRFRLLLVVFAGAVGGSALFALACLLSCCCKLVPSTFTEH